MHYDDKNNDLANKVKNKSFVQNQNSINYNKNSDAKLESPFFDEKKLEPHSKKLPGEGLDNSNLGDERLESLNSSDNSDVNDFPNNSIEKSSSLPNYGLPNQNKLEPSTLNRGSSNQLNRNKSSNSNVSQNKNKQNANDKSVNRFADKSINLQNRMNKFNLASKSPTLKNKKLQRKAVDYYTKANPVVNRVANRFLDYAQNRKRHRELEDKQDGQNENFKVSYKVVVATAILATPVFLIIIFIVLFMSASQIYMKANVLGHSDEVKDKDAEKNIDEIKNDDNKLNEEIDDNDVSFKYDIYIEDNNSLIKYEFTTKKSNYNQEASLKDLEDFYPDIIKYTTDEYNQNDVYKFFKKLYYIYHYYLEKGVKLDMPLIMSVLNLQSSDMAEVFKANTIEYTKEDIEKGTENPDFDIDKDWSSYKSTKNNSAHDIEVLAQGMVKEGTSSSNNKDNSADEHEVTKTGKDAIDKMIKIALQQEKEVHYGGQKYWSWYGFSSRDEWCAMFVSWLFNQVGGLDKYIKKSACAGGTYGHGGIVKDSVEAKLGTWHEDECADPTTKPQPGDVIVFDPWINGTYVPNPENHKEMKYYSSHVGFVYKVDEKYVYTVEGNSSDRVNKKAYERKTWCGRYGIQGINGYFRPNY